jgi:hypothetical protein
LLSGLYFSEHGANGVYHREQPARNFRRQRKLAVPEPGEKAFSHVSDFLKFAEPQETAASLDRMDGSEDARQKFMRRWIDFKFHQFTIEPVQVLGAFDQEFLNQVIHGTTLFGIVRLGRIKTPAWRG